MIKVEGESPWLSSCATACSSTSPNTKGDRAYLAQSALQKRQFYFERMLFFVRRVGPHEGFAARPCIELTRQWYLTESGFRTRQLPAMQRLEKRRDDWGPSKLLGRTTTPRS